MISLFLVFAFLLHITDAADYGVEQGLIHFVKGPATPLIQEYNDETADTIFDDPHIKKHLLFFTNKKAPYHNEVFSTFRNVATAYVGNLHFVYIPITEGGMLDFCDLVAKDAPTFVLVDFSETTATGLVKKYPFSGSELSSGNITSFINDFFVGNLIPSFKSEDVTPKDTMGDVIVLRSKSFRDLVMNNDKDVLVKFYAPWCGHCQKLGMKSHCLISLRLHDSVEILPFFFLFLYILAPVWKSRATCLSIFFNSSLKATLSI
jgi:thiol-disulfide isomerase/thioredoxin